MSTTIEEKLSDNVTLYRGDSREVIPTLDKVNCVISDFPYGIEEMVGGYARSGIGRHGRIGKSGSLIANDKNLDTVDDVLKLLQIHQQNIWLAAFYSCRISPEFFQLTKELEYFGEMIWDKRTAGLGRQIRYQHENIAFFKIGTPQEELSDCFSVMSYVRVANYHPHEKPVQVMSNICSIIPGKIILDPFMGSGSTGVAAVQLKRGFIGIEYEQKYFDIARKRVEEALKQPVAFWE